MPLYVHKHYITMGWRWMVHKNLFRCYFLYSYPAEAILLENWLPTRLKQSQCTDAI